MAVFICGKRGEMGPLKKKSVWFYEMKWKTCQHIWMMPSTIYWLLKCFMCSNNSKTSIRYNSDTLKSEFLFILNHCFRVNCQKKCIKHEANVPIPPFYTCTHPIHSKAIFWSTISRLFHTTGCTNLHSFHPNCCTAILCSLLSPL